jgi:3-oxoacyl-[acyl-carrier protein] reductase
MIELKDKVALITGASRGIGRAAALYLARAGCNILVHYWQNRLAAVGTVNAVRKCGVAAESFATDIARREQVEDLVEFTLKKFNAIDILVNNAGIWEEAAIQEMAEEQLRRTLETNINGVFYAITAVAPHMIERQAGNIINISSTAGQRGEPFHSHYAASKGAIISLTKSLAAELAPHHIRVNCVAPGWVDTDMSRPSLAGADAKAILDQIPLGRVGTPEEIAGCVLFLASELSGFVTGEILNANGGAVLCG